MKRSLLLLCGAFLLNGCLWPVREKTDAVIQALATHPFDVGAPPGVIPVRPTDGKPAPPSGTASPEKKTSQLTSPPLDLQTTAFMQADSGKEAKAEQQGLHVPADLPGSEAQEIQLSKDDKVREEQLRNLYPELPPLPEVPDALPGPNGHPFTLSDLQRLAVENSLTLDQMASDVQAAKGNLIQARLYPNPTFSYEADNVNSAGTAGFQGFALSQPLRSAGKLKLQAAAAEMDLRNAELALKRARFDLATQVRNAYVNLLVAKETVRVTRALSVFTDDIYRLQADLVKAAQAASYEPIALRAQAGIARLSYRQAIQTYLYAWKQLATAVNLCQLPLAEVAGRIDVAIPCFDYDAVKERVLHNHTDILIALNGIEKARYQLKLAQIIPWFQDPSLNVVIQKDFTTPPFAIAQNILLGMPISVWDQNQGNIIAAQAALVRASDQPSAVELTLTTNLTNAFVNYKNSLLALEHYRRDILPDMVQASRGVYRRRHIEGVGSLGDTISAQLTLTASVTTYLTTLGQLWTSVVQVADLLQTDDLFECAKPRQLPALPAFAPLPKKEGLPEQLPAPKPGKAAPGPKGPQANGKEPQLLPPVISTTSATLPDTAPLSQTANQEVVPVRLRPRHELENILPTSATLTQLLEPPPAVGNIGEH